MKHFSACWVLPPLIDGADLLCCFALFGEGFIDGRDDAVFFFAMAKYLIYAIA